MVEVGSDSVVGKNGPNGVIEGWDEGRGCDRGGSREGLCL